MGYTRRGESPPHSSSTPKVNVPVPSLISSRPAYSPMQNSWPEDRKHGRAPYGTVPTTVGCFTSREGGSHELWGRASDLAAHGRPSRVVGGARGAVGSRRRLRP